METFNIDEFIANIPDDKLLIINDKTELDYDDIHGSFEANPNLIAIKYTAKYETSNDFAFSKFRDDIVTNIRAGSIDTIVINNKKNNINNTLPLMVMLFTDDIKLLINEPTVIEYDAYLLSTVMRDSIRRKIITNNNGILFYAGGTYNL